MKEWTADICNNPDDDLNLVVELWHGDENCGLIVRGKQGLELIWYASDQDHNIPVEWLVGLLQRAKSVLNPD